MTVDSNIKTAAAMGEADAPVKRRGRPPLTEEQKAARKEAAKKERAAVKTARLGRLAEQHGLKLVPLTDIAETDVRTYPPDHEFEFHPACLFFDEMTDEDLAEQVDDITQNGLVNPITRLPDGRVIDGKNRTQACRKAGSPIRAQIYTGTDPVAYAISLNDRRRHSTKARRREIIAALLQENPSLSDRMIGRMAGASKNTVAAERARQEAGGQIDHQEARTDKRGRRQPATTRKAAAKQSAAAPRHNDGSGAKIIHFPEQPEPSPSVASAAEASITHVLPAPEPPKNNAERGSFPRNDQALNAELRQSDQPTGPPTDQPTIPPAEQSQARPGTLSRIDVLHIPRDPLLVAKLVHKHWREDEGRRLIAELRYFFPSDDFETAAPTEADDASPNAARFSVNYGSPAEIAKRLSKKLTPKVFREVIGSMCDLVPNNGLHWCDPEISSDHAATAATASAKE